MNQLATDSSCSQCDNISDYFCHGCETFFCQFHANEHRQTFYDQLDWLTVDHDDLLDLLNHSSSIQQTNDQSKKIIDKWEEDSIKYIQKTADEARQALQHAIQTHINEVKQRLEIFKEKIQILSNNDHIRFDERDLKEWSKEIQFLRQEFLTAPSFTVRIHGNKPVVMPIIKIQPQDQHCHSPTTYSSGLVPIHSSHTERFSLHTDHVQIFEHGQIFRHDTTRNDASIRGFQEYSHGEHQLFFRLEHLTSNQWMFFGITSKHAKFDQRAYQNSTAYGWTGYNSVYINGKSTSLLNGYLNDLQENDLIELIIDCDRQRLIFWHSRQNYKSKLSIDIQMCPFPWQLLICCQYANDSVRILPTSMSLLIKQEQDKLSPNMNIKEAKKERNTSMKN